ncbi:DUF6055 domain-containing protein [Bacteroidales bacterium OttesenSCG-928-L03]|nr:DUF6055 domain-containing protein [Bacteroidales bacterium OttesenSCG-928-L03]
MKKSLQFLLVALLLTSNLILSHAQDQVGDIITVNGAKYKLNSENLITNPGFESGFTGWTDATDSPAELASAYFTIMASGGVNNSKYLVGTTNQGAAAVGSIGTGWQIEAGKTYYFSYQVKYQDSSKAANTEPYLKVSLTNNKMASAEPKVIIASTSLSAGGAWTRNEVIFTNTNPSYSYIVARFRWLDSKYGFDNFQLQEVQEIPNTDGLQETIDEAQAFYRADAQGAEELLAAINLAQVCLTNGTSAEILQAIADLQAAILAYRYANASPENPINMTHFITNPGFDSNESTGWKGAGTINYNEVEFYQSTFDMYQSIEGLPAGKYILKAQGFERPKANDGGSAYRNGTETIYAYFYAQATDFAEKTAPFNSLYKHTYSGSDHRNGYVDNMSGARTMLTNKNNYYEVSLPNILLDEGATLTIGARSEFQQSGYWALFDNFRLEYAGAYDTEDLAASLIERINEAQNLLPRKIQTELRTTLTEAIQAAQATLSIDPLTFDGVAAAKASLDIVFQAAEESMNAYSNLQTVIAEATVKLDELEKVSEIERLQTAITTATEAYNSDLTVQKIDQAITALKSVMSAVGKKIYIANWSMGNVNDDNNAWNYSRSRQSKNWIIFWEKGFNDNPNKLVCGGSTVDVDWILAQAEQAFAFYADSLKFIKRGSSKTDTYKMVIRLRYSTDWEASGSGVDNLIGLLTLTPWAAPSRSGQTLAHEVGHCFQYQVHCDNNDNNGWMYGFGSGASGGNGFWEQCAQWQAYKIFPEEQFGNEWFSGYLSNAHKHILHEAPRYNNYFIQDYWTYRHGMDMIGRLWNQSKSPEDPVETYKRITGITQNEFNDEMYDCAARFATWDIPALKSYGANHINSRPTPAMTKVEDNYWRIDPSVCIENYGHNIIRLNAPTKASQVSVFFEGLRGVDGYRNIQPSQAGWRYGFVALLNNGERVYSDMGAASYKTAMTDTLHFGCPANCSRLWLVVSGAPSIHWKHPWDDNDTNDEQWPYQIKFNNTNRYGYTNIVTDIQEAETDYIQIYASDNTLYINELPVNSLVNIHDITGRCLQQQTPNGESFSTTLPSGIYVVHVQSKQGVVSRKVLIQ